MEKLRWSLKSTCALFGILFLICELTRFTFLQSSLHNIQVLVLEGHSQLSYELDEGLVEFGTAVHDNDFGRAVLYLESLQDRSVAEGMWQNLGAIALAQNNLLVAERCYAALGDVSRTYFLRETVRIAKDYAKVTGKKTGM